MLFYMGNGFLTLDVVSLGTLIHTWSLLPRARSTLIVLQSLLALDTKLSGGAVSLMLAERVRTAESHDVVDGSDERYAGDRAYAV
jgi:hypothetical protein